MNIKETIKAKQIVFNKLKINVREIHYKNGKIEYQLCYYYMYAIKISKEEYEILKRDLENERNYRKTKTN